MNNELQKYLIVCANLPNERFGQLYTVYISNGVDKEQLEIFNTLRDATTYVYKINMILTLDVLYAIEKSIMSETTLHGLELFAKEKRTDE